MKNLSMDQAIDRVKGMLSRIVDPNADFGGMDSSWLNFGDEEHGDISLGGDDAEQYRGSLLDLFQAIESKDNEQFFSRPGIEGLLRQAILRAKGSKEHKGAFDEENIRKAVAWLRKEVKQDRAKYVAYLPVQGIAPGCLPVKFGRVSFLPATREVIEPLATLVAKVPLHHEEGDEERVRAAAIKNLTTILDKRCVACIEVEARDDTHATDRAVQECRRTIDTLNFFVEYIEQRDTKVCVSLIGEGGIPLSNDSRDMVLAFRSTDAARPSGVEYDGRTISGTYWTMGYKGPLAWFGFSFLNDEQSNKLLRRMCQFASDALLEERADRGRSFKHRVLTSMMWAGRASVSHRLDDSFLFYMIALESLVLGRENKGELNYRLSVRTAYLLNIKPGGRAFHVDTVGELYKTRSAIVHCGERRVAKLEVDSLRKYVGRALETVILDPAIANFEKAAEFDRWLDEQILSGPVR